MLGRHVLPAVQPPMPALRVSNRNLVQRQLAAPVRSCALVKSMCNCYLCIFKQNGRTQKAQRAIEALARARLHTSEARNSWHCAWLLNFLRCLKFANVRK